MTSLAQSERQALVETFRLVGPDAPTLCEGWLTRDLAAHLVLREGDPLASVGIFVGPLAGWTARVQERISRDDWQAVLGRLRRPPVYSPFRLPAVERQANTGEFFIHHEDVLRARDDWAPRELSDAVQDELWATLRRMAKLGLRRSRVGVVLKRPSGDSYAPRAGARTVTITGEPSELLMYVAGRGEHAHVEVTGAPVDVEQLQALGLHL